MLAWNTLMKLINGWKCVLDAVVYVNIQWQLTGINIAGDNKNAIIYGNLSVYEKLTGFQCPFAFSHGTLFSSNTVVRRKVA